MAATSSSPSAPETPASDQATSPFEPKLLKAMIAAARHSDGPTLFSIFQVDADGKCEVHEQLPDGGCTVWPETYGGRCQAEGAIYLRAKATD